MENLAPCVRLVNAVTITAVLFVIATLRAAEGKDFPTFPACKQNVGATDIEHLVAKNPCMFLCPPVVNMVCSNDGMSHMNDCFLCKSACHNQDKPIFKVCDGRCPCKGKPHDEEMETAEDCKDGKCAKDAEDHYAEDYGYDVEAPEAKYTSPVYTENPHTLHESRGYSEAKQDDEEDDDEEEDAEDEEEGDDGEEWEVEEDEEVVDEAEELWEGADPDEPVTITFENTDEN